MAKKKSPLDKLISAPWWVSIMLAGIVYLIGKSIPDSAMPDMATTAILNMFKGLTYPAAIMFVIIGIISLICSLFGKK